MSRRELHPLLWYLACALLAPLPNPLPWGRGKCLVAGGVRPATRACGFKVVLRSPLSPDPSPLAGRGCLTTFPRPGGGRTGRGGWRPLPLRSAARDDG